MISYKFQAAEVKSEAERHKHLTYLAELDAVLSLLQFKPHNVGFVHRRSGL